MPYTLILMSDNLPPPYNVMQTLEKLQAANLVLPVSEWIPRDGTPKEEAAFSCLKNGHAYGLATLYV